MKMNVCIFSGRITKDAETRTTTTGTSITSFSIAVDSGFGDKKRTDFINVKAFKRDNLTQYLTKGKPVMVSGELQIEKWTDKSGVEKTGVTIIARDIDFQQGDKGQAAPAQSAKGRKEHVDMGDAPF
jgi:single-strand DNA-binding protein